MNFCKRWRKCSDVADFESDDHMRNQHSHGECRPTFLIYLHTNTFLNVICPKIPYHDKYRTSDHN